MVTADDSSETLKKSFEAGADDFISKPIGSERLLQIINKHIFQE